MPDVDIHGLFYTICQSLFYIICFHHNSLVLVDRNYFNLLLIDKIVLHSINPLKFCISSILQEFSRISTLMGFNACQELVEKNKQLFLSSRSSSGASNYMEFYFPFDPYLLRISSKYIQPLYKEFHPHNHSEDLEHESSVENDTAQENNSLPSSYNPSPQPLSPSTGPRSIEQHGYIDDPMNFTPTSYTNHFQNLELSY